MTTRAKEEMDKRLDEIFAKNQAKLPEEDRAATTEMCEHKHDGWSCTKQIGHTGDHIAHGRLGTIHERWSA